MNLIFEGLRRRDSEKKHAPKDRLSTSESASPDETSTRSVQSVPLSKPLDSPIDTSVLPKHHAKNLKEPDLSCVTVDCSAKKSQKNENIAPKFQYIFGPVKHFDPNTSCAKTNAESNDKCTPHSKFHRTVQNIQMEHVNISAQRTFHRPVLVFRKLLHNGVVSLFYLPEKVFHCAILSFSVGKGIVQSFGRVSHSALDKLLSFYVPNTWIPNVTAFALRSCAIALSCCFAVMLAKHLINPHAITTAENRSKNTVILAKNAEPKRKLKHLFRDPLVVQQKKVSNALLAMRVDTIQRSEKGKGSIIINDQTYGLGTQLTEHPSVWLEKIGKNSLYFSDKYGQLYKRAIQDLLE